MNATRRKIDKNAKFFQIYSKKLYLLTQCIKNPFGYSPFTVRLQNRRGKVKKSNFKWGSIYRFLRSVISILRMTFGFKFLRYHEKRGSVQKTLTVTICYSIYRFKVAEFFSEGYFRLQSSSLLPPSPHAELLLTRVEAKVLNHTPISGGRVEGVFDAFCQ